MLKIYADMPDRDAVEEVVDLLRSGGVIIIPTGAGYVMACDALQQRPIERICRIKSRASDKKPLAILCADISQAAAYCKLGDGAYKFIRTCESGAFTFILPAAGRLPKAFKARKEVGLRLCNHPIARAIIEELGSPLMVGSLKTLIGDEPEYATDPELANERFGHLVDNVIDGGIDEWHLSTVVGCADDSFTVIRQGEGVID